MCEHRAASYIRRTRSRRSRCAGFTTQQAEPAAGTNARRYRLARQKHYGLFPHRHLSAVEPLWDIPAVAI